MRKFNKLDRTAPRFRKEKIVAVNNQLFLDFKEEFPQYKKVSNADLRLILKTFHKYTKDIVSDTRDGVELLEQLGHMFLGSSCKKKGIDYIQSDKLGVEVSNQNWESNQWLCKLYYTTFGTKYRFRNSHLWGFEAIRQFKSQLSRAYIKNYKLYIITDNIRKISDIFRKHNTIFWNNKRVKTEEE